MKAERRGFRIYRRPLFFIPFPADLKLDIALCYDGAIMMARTQITLERETHKRARQRASELGVSLAEYFRRLVRKDLGTPKKKADVSVIFNLGRSRGVSNIAKNKDRMIGEAIAAEFGRSRR